MRRIASFLAFVSVPAFVFACTGGSGDLGGGSSSTSSGSSSTSSSGSGSSSSGSAGTEIRASSFDQSCSVNEDCVGVFQGAICSPCRCQNAAIAKKDLATYTAASSREGCPTTDVACAADCRDMVATCAMGTCAIAVKSGSDDAGASD